MEKIPYVKEIEGLSIKYGRGFTDLPPSASMQRISLRFAYSVVQKSRSIVAVKG